MSKWTSRQWITQALKEVFTPERGRIMAMLSFCFIALIMLDLSGAINPVVEWLKSDSMTFHFNDRNFSAYHIISSITIIILMLWLVGVMLRIIERRIRLIKGMRASNRTLIIKAIYVVGYFLLFLQALHILGINMTALAVFSGAVGIGVGFGLQKITSNFISGIILLFEKTVEEGDLVELSDGTTGFVRMTSGRYTRLETPDGKEVMIPNEDFITQKVTNSTYSNKLGRIEIPVGVSYDSDIVKARELMLEAAREHPRCSKFKDKAPSCPLRTFGEYSVSFTLFFWIDDVIEGTFEPQSDVMFSIWKKFKEHGISIPYPQRDLHIKEMPAISLREKTAS